ncbi:MAG: AAA family ATPase [Casimicrobiaceae bacterium]
MDRPPLSEGSDAATQSAGQESASRQQVALIAGLRGAMDAGGTPARVLETHISYVLLTGTHAYKIKKAVRLGFLDFTTLAKRRHYCEEELRLNRRLAPGFYLDVVAITGTAGHPQIGGAGPVLEYAVKMLEFPQEALLGDVLAHGALTADHIDRLAAIVAAFHARAAVAAPDMPFGDPEGIQRLALANFSEIRPLLEGREEQDAIEALESWTRREYASRHQIFAGRRQAGFVRECHGDLHLGNIALVDGELVIFDCIEFNEQMRWIDVMSEIAFTVMDLTHGGRPAFAHRFLSAYLECTGDYSSVGVLRYYLVYRAMVRAKVACLRAAARPAEAGNATARREVRDYVRLAGTCAAYSRPALVITHGFAGCGKSTLSQALLERIGAVRIRTDVERKRLHGLRAHDSSGSGIGGRLYAAEATRATYDHVATLARAVIDAGRNAIVDATFLQRWQRDAFRTFAAQLRVPFAIVDIPVPEAALRERLAQRARRGTDVSEADIAVLDYQLRTAEPLTADEQGDVVQVDGDRPLRDLEAADMWRDLQQRLDAPT